MAPAHKYEVPNGSSHHRQNITYQGGKLQLMLMGAVLERIPQRENVKGVSYKILVQPWLRKQFDIIENYVRQNFAPNELPDFSPEKEYVYKPLWRGSEMFVSATPFCSYLQFNSAKGQLESVLRDSIEGKGTYNITLEAPYIYVGPHKYGQDYSLSLDIVQVIFYPEEAPFTPPAPAKAPSKRGRPKGSVTTPAQQV